MKLIEMDSAGSVAAVYLLKDLQDYTAPSGFAIYTTLYLQNNCCLVINNENNHD